MTKKELAVFRERKNYACNRYFELCVAKEKGLQDGINYESTISCALRVAVEYIELEKALNSLDSE